MYKVSKQYLERIYSGGAKSKAKIKFNGVELKDANRLIEKITIKRRILANGSERFSLDNFIATEIEMILHNVSLDTIKEPVDISIGTLVGDTYEYVPIGIFKIEGSPTTDKDKTTLQLRDNAIKFDFNYNAQPVIDNNGGSATLKQIFNNICELAEVETDVTSFNGEDLKFGIFDNTITARQYISYIAEQAGMMATIDRTGKLTFVDLNSDSAQIISGKTVTFDSELERSMSFQVNGNTEQTTYTGKNVIPLKQYNYTNKGVTVTTDIETGVITINGTCEEDNTAYVIFDDFILNGSYSFNLIYLSGTISNTTNTTRLHIADKDWGNQFYLPFVNSNNYTSRENISNVTYKYHFIRIDKDVTFNNYKVKVQLVKGINSDYDYEPYVGGKPSPNPDYPQEIVNVRGVENLFYNVVTNSTPSGITITQNDDGSFILNGTTTGVSIFNFKLPKALSAGTYTFSIEGSDNIPGEVFLRARDNNWAMVSTDAQVQGNNKTKNSHTFTCEKEIVIVALNITKAGKTFNNFVIRPMLSKKKSNYVPYGSNYLQLENKSKNVLIYPYVLKSTYTHNGITYVPNDDGSVTINGTATSDSWFALSSNSQDWYLDSETYEFTVFDKNEASVNGITPQYWSAKNGHHRGQNGVLTLNYSEDNTTGWNFVILVYKGTTVSNVTVYPMIRKANVQDTSFEPYKSESTLIDLKGNELCSNKDKTVKDNLFVTKNGKVEIFKKIGKVVLTGADDEHWSISTYAPNQDNTIYFNSNKYDNLFSNRNVLSNYFTYVQKLWDTDKEGIYYDTSNASSIRIRINKTIASTVAEFKTWLSTHNVEIQGELKNPETIELDTVTPLKSYIGQNNISNNADADMNVTYNLKRQPFEIPIRIVESLEKDETYKIGRVEYEDALRKFEQGEQDDYLYINSANPYISNQKQISDIYELLNGYTIDTFKTGKIIGNPALDGYDLIKFIYKNKEYITLNQGTLTFNGVMIQTNETTIGTEAKQSNVTVKSQAAKFKRAFTEIDAVNAQVKITTEQTNTIQDNLTNNYYTIEQSNTLIQNAQSGLTNTFSEAGGNNIFRNTGLWFSQSDMDNPYEYWTGKNVSKQNTDKSSNGSLMMLKKGTLEQEQVVSNGNYTVSFKYKKLIQLATCKVIVNDNEYELTQMTDTEWQTGSKDADGNIVIKPLEVTSNHINVKFTSTVNNAIEIYDLMVNAGTVKLAYSQNENEVTTDTVNISKGITITSSANDTKFKANADGIRIVDKNNEKTTLTEFTDKGMSTKEMEVENGATIVKVLVQNVGNQTWFTRI